MKIIENYDLFLGIVSAICLTMYIILEKFLFSPILAVLLSSVILYYGIKIYSQRKVLLKIEEDNEKKDCYVASIIHDLKNSLIAQCRILENLIHKKENDKELCNQYKLMLSSGKILLETIMEVTNTYKYSDGKINYNFQKFNITELVQDVCQELTFLTEVAEFMDIKLEENLEIFGDKLHIRRVISNLIANAIKYHRENSIITVMLYSENNSCIFAVKNIGYYLKPSQQKEIFEKYVTQSNRFNSISTGLGLYLSKKIIEDGHNGKIYVKSTEDGINTFEFCIPHHILQSNKNRRQYYHGAQVSN